MILDILSSLNPHAVVIALILWCLYRAWREDEDLR